MSEEETNDEILTFDQLEDQDGQEESSKPTEEPKDCLLYTSPSPRDS